MTDHFDLARFVNAQESYFELALAELRAGQKRSHWMWFVFPQLRGLGLSTMAHHFGINSLAEAQAYLAHPTLGPRLAEAVDALQGLAHRLAMQVFWLHRRHEAAVKPDFIH
ncbi:MAG TPA: DUF1810 family protein [Sphingomicrobium sp.]|nr:DUF1810 family protein [Sphingomicrobium sp.]